MIANQYLLPKIMKENGIPQGTLSFDEPMLRFIIEDYTAEAGVRALKSILTDSVMEYNRQRLLQDSPSFDMAFIKEVLRRKRPMTHENIPKEPTVGFINGLYATSVGLGGITPIQIKEMQAKTPFELLLTGNQGKVMQESMKCSLTVAWGLLTPRERTKLQRRKPFGIHIHVPSGATPKDGPSAGTAISLALLSFFQQRKIRNDIAITGEIELSGNVTEIGGLGEKLVGAKKAGVRQAFIPEENEKDLRKLIEDGIVTLDKSFNVTPVSHITQLLDKIFV